MASPQTLSLADRRIVAAWAADCAEHVLGLVEAETPEDDRPRDAIARTRAFARGELAVADEIRRRFKGSGAARDVRSPAAVAAARAAGQAEPFLTWERMPFVRLHMPPRRQASPVQTSQLQ
jgi:hypothetical protein